MTPVPGAPPATWSGARMSCVWGAGTPPSIAGLASAAVGAIAAAAMPATTNRLNLLLLEHCPSWEMKSAGCALRW